MKLSLIILTSIVMSAQVQAPKNSTYTLIESTEYKFENKLNCEIAVVTSRDKQTVKVARLEDRKGTFSVNYFAKSTDLFKDYGIDFNLDEIFQLNGAPISYVGASFDLKDSKHDLVLKITTRNPASLQEEYKSKRIPLGKEFFLDYPRNCLK